MIDKKIRIGTTGGESDDASLVSLASRIAASRDKGSSIIVTNPLAYQGGDYDSTDGDVNGDYDSEKTKSNATIMKLLPSSCRQGVLCRVSTRLSNGGVAEISDDVVVLLGSTLGGTGVFSGADGTWFERVCAHLALATESSSR